MKNKREDIRRRWKGEKLEKERFDKEKRWKLIQ